MIVFGNDDAGVDAAAEAIVSSFGHLPGGLAGSYQYNTAGKSFSRQGAADGFIGFYCVNGRTDDGIGIISKLLIHRDAPCIIVWKQAGETPACL